MLPCANLTATPQIQSIMAERPPKAPTFHLKTTPTTEPNSKTSTPTVAPQLDPPPWANRFADFCRVKRAARRGDAAESTSSIDSPEFDRLDEEFLLSMFPENRGQVSASNAMPEILEHNSNTLCEVDKKELEEEDSSEYKADTDVQTGGTQIEASSPPEVTSPMDGEGASTTDPKRVKRCVVLGLPSRVSTRVTECIKSSSFDLDACMFRSDQFLS